MTNPTAPQTPGTPRVDHAENYADSITDLAEMLRPLETKLAAANAKLERFKCAGIVELAASNPNLGDYMKHWEGRAEKAEAVLAQRAPAPAKTSAKVDKCRGNVTPPPPDGTPTSGEIDMNILGGGKELYIGQPKADEPPAQWCGEAAKEIEAALNGADRCGEPYTTLPGTAAAIIARHAKPFMVSLDAIAYRYRQLLVENTSLRALLLEVKDHHARGLEHVKNQERTLTEYSVEVAALRAWKESALAVSAKLDIQAIGKELGCLLGTDISPQVLPGIRALRARVGELVGKLKKEREEHIQGIISTYVYTTMKDRAERDRAVEHGKDLEAQLQSEQVCYKRIEQALAAATLRAQRLEQALKEIGRIPTTLDIANRVRQALAPSGGGGVEEADEKITGLCGLDH